MAVECAVVEHDAGLLAVLTGTLDLDAVASLRLRLFKCLSEQPGALFLDVSGMSVQDPLAMTVFVVVARQAARWPGVPVLLCGPSASVCAVLPRVAYRRLPVFPSVEAAADQAGVYGRSLPALSDILLPIAGAARQARTVATDACLRWGLEHLIGPASLIADEFVSNVVDHANTMATLRLSLRHRFLTIAVQDGSSAAPIPPDGTPDAGRGLLLVRASAHSWGWTLTEGGKVLWANLLRQHRQ